MTDKGKIVLILGNGFDLAHGLPTKYSHFLDFCQRVERIWSYGTSNDKLAIADFKRKWIDDWETDESIKETILTDFGHRKIKINSEGIHEKTLDSPELTEIHDLLDDNTWYEYFTERYINNHMKGENWIDFESEIRFIIKVVDEYSLSLTDIWNDVINKAVASLNDQKLKIFNNKFLTDKYINRKGWSSKHLPTVKDFREKTFEDLERLTRALELYLVTFVEKIPISDSKKIPEISSLTPDYVINFNYTDTYERIYNKGKVYHIHGKADAARSAEDNNMVLGIDEYWTGDEQNERTNFTIFKKFSQRIQKHTGNESYKYLKEMQKVFEKRGKNWSGNVDMSKVHPDGVSYVYVFGHSLDVTDKDILSNFIGDDSTSVTVYCRDRGTEGELIANTIKLIHEEKLLDKSNHVPTKLNYVIQKINNC